MLSKTDFLLYLEAPLHLWAKAHNQLIDKPPTPYEQHLMQQGQQVEALAKKYIDTTLVRGEDHLTLLWQKTFDDRHYQIRTDALIYDQKSDNYDLYEIKSSTSIKTDHEYDLAFQVLLLESLLKLRHVYLIHINKTYELGESLTLDQFFTFEEVSVQVEKRREAVRENRQAAYAVLQMPTPPTELACAKPKSCPCPSLCHPDLPEKSIYNIPRIGKKAVQLREMGITAIHEIPEDFNLNIKQRKHRDAVKNNRPLIETVEIRHSLAKLQFPLYFLDYETFNPAIPLFEGYRPYEHIVFQYSLFRINTPGQQPIHNEYLITEEQDPAPDLVRELFKHLGPEGSVVVWNQSFESGCNANLARHCPAYADWLLQINDRLYDLMLIFRNGHYVHPDFHGSASLKAVLPVLCPDLKYENLSISNGEEAMLAWYRLQKQEIEQEERQNMEEAMRAYCKMDTYGMVAIWEHLRKL